MLETANRRLLKTLADLGFSLDANKAKDEVIAARKGLEDLYKQAIAVKDLIIQYQDELIKRLRGNSKGFMGRLKSLLGIAEKVALIALGALARGL